MHLRLLQNWGQVEVNSFSGSFVYVMTFLPLSLDFLRIQISNINSSQLTIYVAFWAEYSFAYFPNPSYPSSL